MSENSLIDGKFILCPSCKQKISPRAMMCPKCNIDINKACDICQENIVFDSVFCPKCGDPNPFNTENNSNKDLLEKGSLSDCPFCGKPISNRSKKCIHCNTVTNIPCPLCKTKILIWNTTCRECGEPDPFKDIFHSTDNTGEILRITKIKQDSQAELLGLKENDIIVTYNGFEIKNNEDLSKASQIAKHDKNNEIIIVISRDDKKLVFTAKAEPLGISCENNQAKPNTQREVCCESSGSENTSTGRSQNIALKSSVGNGEHSQNDEFSTIRIKNSPLPPSKVINAVKLLYATIGLGIIRSIIEFSRQSEASSVEFVLMIMLFTLGITLFFIYMIGKGKNWARITFLVLFILGSPLSISPMIQSLSHEPISGALGLLQIIMQVMGLVLLFQSDSSAWFKAMKNMKSAQNE